MSTPNITGFRHVWIDDQVFDPEGIFGDHLTHEQLDAFAHALLGEWGVGMTCILARGAHASPERSDRLEPMMPRPSTATATKLSAKALIPAAPITRPKE